MKVTKEHMRMALQPTVNRVKTFDWSNKQLYANWTAQTFYIVTHSTRLFAYAAARTPLDNPDFHNRFLKHMLEEKGHENLASTDLKGLGYQLSDFPELASTSALYQTQYYWINEVSPYSFFGYLIALEGLAATVGADVHQQLNKTHKANTTKFLKVHSEEDLEHIEEVYSWVAKIPDMHQKHVLMNLTHSAHYYDSMLTEILTAKKVLRPAS